MISGHERHFALDIRKQRFVVREIVTHAFHFDISAGSDPVHAVHDFVIRVIVISQLLIVLNGDVGFHPYRRAGVVGEIDFEAVVVEGHRNGLSPRSGESKVVLQQFDRHSAVEVYRYRSLGVAVQIPYSVVHTEGYVVNSVIPLDNRIRRILHGNAVAYRIAHEAVVIRLYLVHYDADGHVSIARHVDEVSVGVAHSGAGSHVGSGCAVAVGVV